MACIGDETNFETRAGPTRAHGGDEGAQEDYNMADVLDFFT